MTALRAINRTLVRVEGWLLVLFLSTMVVVAFAQVVLRNFADTGLAWGDILVRQMVLWTGFTGAALAASEDRHISIDVLAKFIPDRPRFYIKMLTSAFASIVCLFLARAAWVLMLSEQESDATIIFSIPEWVALTIIPAGYLLLAIHFALNVVSSALTGFQSQASDA
jgi:TRAP-type C4-dicarboxylate transport system permease small subunit